LPDTIATPQPVSVTRAVAGYVVVSHWTGASGHVDTEYERFDHLNDAADTYTDYENGEHRRARPVGIFPCDANGMPVDKALDAHTIARLVRETKAA
jgi:hypothetical protein